MADDKILYKWSRAEAERSDEMELWQESYNENCLCARAIEDAIKDNYKNYSLDANGAKEVISKYGYDRVNWVLANTVRENTHDGRYSRENKDWAQCFNVPKDGHMWNYNFTVISHPALVDLFISQARKQWQDLGLWDRKHCYDGNLDFTGKVVALSPNVLKDEYKTPDDQLFYASVGNGCRPDAIGTKVFGHFLKDGEEAHFRRGSILGVVKIELLPDWAKAKLAQENHGEAAEQTKPATAPTEPATVSEDTQTDNKNVIGEIK